MLSLLKCEPSGTDGLAFKKRTLTYRCVLREHKMWWELGSSAHHASCPVQSSCCCCHSAHHWSQSTALVHGGSSHSFLSCAYIFKALDYSNKGLPWVFHMGLKTPFYYVFLFIAVMIWLLFSKPEIEVATMCVFILCQDCCCVMSDWKQFVSFKEKQCSHACKKPQCLHLFGDLIVFWWKTNFFLCSIFTIFIFILIS